SATWHLKQRAIARELLVRNRHAAKGPLAIALLDPPPELLGGNVEITQLDTHSQGASAEPLLIPLETYPQPKLQDHPRSRAEHLLGESPKQLSEPLTYPLVMQIDAQARHPVVRAKTNGGGFLRQPPRERRLARAGQSAQEDQSWVAGLSHRSLRDN